jgi:hypothetical protein
MRAAETAWFAPIWEHAAAILFMADRIKFCRPDGSEQPANSGAPPVLCAFGSTAVKRVQQSGIAGALVTKWQWQGSISHQPSVGRGSSTSRAQADLFG